MVYALLAPCESAHVRECLVRTSVYGDFGCGLLCIGAHLDPVPGVLAEIPPVVGGNPTSPHTQCILVVAQGDRMGAACAWPVAPHATHVDPSASIVAAIITYLEGP